MLKCALLAMIIALPAAAPAWAQDIAGLEDCTKTSGLDKRTGCLQSNIDVLSRMILKSAADTQQKLGIANNQITAMQRTLSDLRTRIDNLEKTSKKPDKP